MITQDSEAKRRRVDKMKCAHPDWGSTRISNATGISRTHVRRLLAQKNRPRDPASLNTAAVVSFYFGEGKYNKEFTGGHFGITDYHVAKILAEHGYPEHSYPSILKNVKVVENNGHGLTDKHDIAYIRLHWREFISSLRGEGTSGNLDAFLRSATDPIALHDGILTLGFYYSFHKDKIESSPYLELVESRLQQVFGQPYKINCVLLNTAVRAGGTSDMTSDEVIREIEATLAPINEQLGQLQQIAALLKSFKILVKDHDVLSQKCLDLEEQNRKHVAKRVELQNLLAQPD